VHPGSEYCGEFMEDRLLHSLTPILPLHLFLLYVEPKVSTAWLLSLFVTIIQPVVFKAVHLLVIFLSNYLLLLHCTTAILYTTTHAPPVPATT
jgi:hypothetical protein